MITKADHLTEIELQTISNIWLRSNTSAHDFIPAKYWNNNFDSVKQQFKSATIYLAYDNEKIAGFMGMQDNYVAGIFIEDINMHHGLGKALICEAKNNYPNLNLSVYVKNQNAIEFYLAQGFSKVSENIDPETNEEEIEMTWSK
ncbi:GNAT family N-acetyltransferase [Companilactobacillus ginsenosidimutans]|uniref:N-acetyltransferase domain-containing protein n=1 Tax=Companilactobacillus ginsenosidimutans TaxID=1007676 RepID=A0A0H4QFT6_9LACO|nr:GNAT family N-acetyltransferase [Companilactobacillus ginsenosidimutans]AKP66822.1 hypothetical protein ABM34_04060 [Companilactobacillus ginsenosidimutans]